MIKPSDVVINARHSVVAHSNSQLNHHQRFISSTFRKLQSHRNDDENHFRSSAQTIASRILFSAAATASLLFLAPTFPAYSATTEKLAEFGSSGLIPVPGVFKDTIQVIELQDPGVDGVVIYFTDYNRSVVERLGSDPFSDPSQSSLACVRTDKNVVIKDPASARGSEGQEIFSQLKSFNPVANLLQNRRTNIRRIWDENNKTLIYVAYSSRFTTSATEGGVSSSRYRTSMCAVRAPLASSSGALLP